MCRNFVVVKLGKAGCLITMEIMIFTLTVFWCIQGVGKGYIGNEWVNVFSTLESF